MGKAPQSQDLVAISERVLIDWRSGMLGSLMPVLDEQGVSVDLVALDAAFLRAQASARASMPGRFNEFLRRVYLHLAHDFALAPRREDVERFVTDATRWLPSTHAASLLERVRNHQCEVAWIGESSPSLARSWRTRLGEPFDMIVDGDESVDGVDVRGAMFRWLERSERPQRYLRYIGEANEERAHLAARLGVQVFIWEPDTTWRRGQKESENWTRGGLVALEDWFARTTLARDGACT